MSLSGNLKTMDLAEVLQWVTMGRKTGALAFIRNKIKNSIIFRNGQIISSRSNEPTKQLGHFLLFQGKITEVQLKRALEIQLQTRTMLGRILVHEGYVSQQDVEQALVSRTEEVIYDLFLWEDGYFHFTAEGYSQDELILINLDINSIIFEGVRRKDEWARIRKVFPCNDILLSLRDGVDLKALPLTSLQKKLLFLLTLRKPVSDIILELHGSDFLVNFELFQLYERDVIEVKEVLSQPVVGDEPDKLFNQGLLLIETRKFREAIAIFQEILRQNPHNAEAHEQIERAERSICEEYYRHTIPAHKVPCFLVSEADLTRHNLTHQEGFVASRINGAWDVKAIVMLSPLREIEILQALDKLISLNLVSLK